jgi:hypothetical protein
MDLFRLFGAGKDRPKDPLVGKWKLVRAEPPLDAGTVLTFSDGGRLDYSIPSQDKVQIIHLTYKVVGDSLITDQPSHPSEEKSRFRIDPDGMLYVEGDGQKAWYRRII